MTDLTDAVETIVSLLKDSSTGIGTTGYEITDDNASSLTIADGEILVNYTMSKEEIKDAFGGSQNYDIIINVKSREIKDDWIGLNARQRIQLVILEVYVIDKWLDIGSGNKYITAPLVRYKVINAIRKFIKSKTQTLGGTITIWEMNTITNSEDTSFRPSLFKSTIVTKAWMYYKEVMVLDCTDVLNCLEDFTEEQWAAITFLFSSIDTHLAQNTGQDSMWHSDTKTTASWEDVKYGADYLDVTLTTEAHTALIIFSASAYAYTNPGDLSVVITVDDVRQDRSAVRTYIHGDLYEAVATQFLKSLSAGSHTIRIQWYVSAGNCELSNCVLSVIELH